MNRNGFDKVIIAMGILILITFLAGCGSALKYAGTAGIDSSKMTPYQKDSIKILVPPGYSEKAIPPESYKQEGLLFKVLGSNPKVASFTKKDSLNTIIVYCWDGLTFVPNNKLDYIAREILTTKMPNSAIVAGTYELGSGYFKKYFEKHSGNIVVKGQNIPMVNWIAWRGTAGFDCKYVIYGTTLDTLVSGSSFEDDFVSMVRNLE